jgi:hypothetical protein
MPYCDIHKKLNMVNGRKKTWLVFSGMITIIITAAGCIYKKDVVEAPCILPAAVTYDAHVQPILSANCYRCHSAATNISGIQLDSYAALKVYALNGQLYGCISHQPGFRPMPDDGGVLDPCSIATIKQWIDSGTPQN